MHITIDKSWKGCYIFKAYDKKNKMIHKSEILFGITSYPMAKAIFEHELVQKGYLKPKQRSKVQFHQIFENMY